MRIDASAVQLSSQSTMSQSYTREERLRAWVGDAPGGGQGGDKVSLSKAATDANSAEPVQQPRDNGDQDPQLNLIRLMIEYLTGRKVSVLELGDIQDPSSAQPSAAPPQQPPAAGYGIQYDSHESLSESERTDFVAQGVIKTADGREIQFSAGLSLEREFHYEADVSVRAGDAARLKDPLVINFSRNAAQLGTGTFRFDLDADGALDRVPQFQPGSGLLAIDRNGDGRINDGSELLGPSSGDGFNELAVLDQDGNGWVDEGDSTFGDLRVWSHDADGHDVVLSLKSAGIGALLAGSVATPFQLAGDDNRQLGQVRASGLYLTESGSAGTLQQIDLAV